MKQLNGIQVGPTPESNSILSAESYVRVRVILPSFLPSFFLTWENKVNSYWSGVWQNCSIITKDCRYFLISPTIYMYSFLLSSISNMYYNKRRNIITLIDFHIFPLLFIITTTQQYTDIDCTLLQYYISALPWHISYILGLVCISATIVRERGGEAIMLLQSCLYY